MNSPQQLAIDTAAGRLYWVNASGSEASIAYANLNGSGAGTLKVGKPFEFASGLVVYPAVGRIYWLDLVARTISYANLDGSGGADLDIGNAPIEDSAALAIDGLAQRIYWSNLDSRTIGFANINGGGGGSLPARSQAFALGLAVDPAAGRLYQSQGGSDPIGFTSLADGTGGGTIDTSGTTKPLVAALSPILLKAPTRAKVGAAASPVTVLPAYKPGAHFSCGIAWAGDLVESNLMQAPQTIAYRWLRNGVPVPGATATTLSPTEVGQYSCQSTATNFAGSTTLSEGSFTVISKLKLGKLKLNRRKGIATLSFSVEGPGRVRLAGKGIVAAKRIAKPARNLKLTIRAKGKAKRKLLATGSARITAKLAFTPDGGKAQPQRRTFVLKRR